MAEFIDREAAIRICERLRDKNSENADMAFALKWAAESISRVPAGDVRPAISREQLIAALEKYFDIGNSYTYELTRVKEAFEIGTMSLQDFVEWDSDKVEDLCDYLFKLTERPVSGA